jgi:hypothetical protein
MGVARFGFRLIDIRQNLLATLQIALASFGERDTARGAIEQACAQMRLEIGNRARRVRRGRIQVLRGTCEAARFDDADKYAHVLKRIHTYPY